MMNATSHSAAVSVFFDDGADLVFERSTSEQVVVKNFTFSLVSFQFFFKLGDGMRDESVIAKNRRRGGFVPELSVDLFVGIRVGDQIRQFLRRGDGGQCRIRIGG